MDKNFQALSSGDNLCSQAKKFSTTTEGYWRMIQYGGGNEVTYSNPKGSLKFKVLIKSKVSQKRITHREKVFLA